jgi:serine/threonine protein kinase/CheY-like chemotaxis protein
MARIIVADDSVIAQKSYEQMLKFLGHEVSVCENGKIAVAAFQENPAELVILDVDMPEMNGFDACMAIRKLHDGVNVPIIMVSVEDSEENIMNGMNAGANDYLIKPVKEQHLIAKLKTFLKYASIHKSDLDLVRNRVEIAGRYAIERLLGYGAHSVVFMAKDKDSGAYVAIKLITTPEIEDFSKAFIETASKIKDLSSPYVIKIFDYGQFAEKFYVVLEYADGGDLAAILKRHRLSEQEAVKLAIDLVKGLKALSEKGIIHFDIKPENIMLSGNDYKLGDFGVMSPRETATVPIRMELWSTAAYLPPEYLDDTGYVDSKSDIYSAAITLYQAVTGDNPFQSEKPAVSMFRQINLVPPTLKSFDSKITSYFSELIRKMLEKDPARRPKLDEIEHLLLHIKELCELPKGEDPEIGNTEKELKKKLDRLIPPGATTPHESPGTTVPKRKSIFRILGMGIGKAAAYGLFIIVFVFALVYMANSFVSKRTESNQPKTNIHMICAKCSIPVKTGNAGIEKEKCRSCGSKMYYCDACNNCGLNFAHPDVPAAPAGIMETIVGSKQSVACPKCGSSDIREY